MIDKSKTSNNDNDWVKCENCKKPLRFKDLKKHLEKGCNKGNNKNIQLGAGSLKNPSKDKIFTDLNARFFTRNSKNFE
jgi:hypothetical protein